MKKNSTFQYCYTDMFLDKGRKDGSNDQPGHVWLNRAYPSRRQRYKADGKQDRAGKMLKR
jgi:hypothetical protein